MGLCPSIVIDSIATVGLPIRQSMEEILHVKVHQITCSCFDLVMVFDHNGVFPAVHECHP